MFNNLIFLNHFLSSRAPRKEAKILITINYPDSQYWTLGCITDIIPTDQEAFKKDVMNLLKKYQN